VPEFSSTHLTIAQALQSAKVFAASGVSLWLENAEQQRRIKILMFVFEFMRNQQSNESSRHSLLADSNIFRNKRCPRFCLFRSSCAATLFLSDDTSKTKKQRSAKIVISIGFFREIYGKIGKFLTFYTIDTKTYI